MFSTSTVESTVISAPANDVWDMIKSMNFNWWELVKEINIKAGHHMQVSIILSSYLSSIYPILSY